jgi:hypothetical protein
MCNFVVAVVVALGVQVLGPNLVVPYSVGLERGGRLEAMSVDSPGSHLSEYLGD